MRSDGENREAVQERLYLNNVGLGEPFDYRPGYILIFSVKLFGEA
jgi:hypothetical protein